MPDYFRIEDSVRRWYIDGEHRAFDWWDMLVNW